MFDWMMYFSPKEFVKDNEDITLDKYKLSAQRLEDLGVETSRARERLKEAADYAKTHQNLSVV